MDEPSRWLPNPNSHGHGVKEVSCSRETCCHKEILAHFSQIFLDHLSTSTSLFVNNIEEGNIFLIYNSTLWANKVSLFNNLTILVMNETQFFPWSTSPSLFYVLTSLTIVIARSFFIFREFEKEDERKLHKYLLHSNLSPSLPFPVPHIGGLIPWPVSRDKAWKYKCSAIFSHYRSLKRAERRLQGSFFAIIEAWKRDKSALQILFF